MKGSDIIKLNIEFYDEEFKEKGDTRHRIGSSLHKPCFQAFRSMLPERSLILDQGCGTGYYAENLISDGHYLECFDLSPEAIKKCKEYFTLAGFDNSQYKLMVQNYLTFDYPDSNYDAVIDHYSLHFLPFEKQKLILNSVFRSLKPKGFFYIGMMLDGCFGELKEYQFKMTDDGGIMIRWSEEIKYRCWYLWDPITIRSFLLSLGFEIKIFTIQ